MCLREENVSGVFSGQVTCAVENILQRKSPHGVVAIDEREVVLTLQQLVKPCRVLYESVGSLAERKAMTARALALEKQAQKLPATERERLAERLLVGMKQARLTAVDEAWVAEAEKRFGAWRRKATKTVSAGKALREIHSELRH